MAQFAQLIEKGVRATGTAFQERAAGAQKSGELEVAAKQEELAAIQREGDRKARLAEALASQNAAAGARGIAAFEGSPLTILQEDIRKEEKATQRDIFQTQLGVLTKKASAKMIRRQTRLIPGLIRGATTNQ